jgi:hypothetical protein
MLFELALELVDIAAARQMAFVVGRLESLEHSSSEFGTLFRFWLRSQKMYQSKANRIQDKKTMNHRYIFGRISYKFSWLILLLYQNFVFDALVATV